MTSLLPPNATKFELDLETTVQFISRVDVPIAKLWNPWLCPVELLPWLAWALSVDDWSSNWPENVKRQVIAESVVIHRLKGTVGAVKRAMSALGVQVDLVEWWQDGSTPGTFKVTAWSHENLTPDNDTILSAELLAQLIKAIENTKPVSRTFSLRLGALFRDGITLASASRVLSTVQTSARAKLPALDGANGINVAALTKINSVERTSAKLALAPLSSLTSLNTACTVRGLSICQFSMELT